MKILVVSDTHKNFHNLNEVVQKNLDIDLMIHLGDGEHEFSDIYNLYPQLNFVFVKGNSDYGNYKTVRVISAKGYKILCVHGHEHNVHNGLDKVIEVAKDNGCQIALFGHTHLYRTEFMDNIYLMNPGSIDSPRNKRVPTYGIIEIDDEGKILLNIVEYK